MKIVWSPGHPLADHVLFLSGLISSTRRASDDSVKAWRAQTSDPELRAQTAKPIARPYHRRGWAVALTRSRNNESRAGALHA